MSRPKKIRIATLNGLNTLLSEILLLESDMPNIAPAPRDSKNILGKLKGSVPAVQKVMVTMSGNAAANFPSNLFSRAEILMNII